MKRLALLLPLLALAAALRAGAAEPSTTAHAGGWGVDDRTAAPHGGVTVTELPAALRGAARVDVPRQLLGRPVTALAPGLFAGCANLAKVRLPASLAAIPDEAFRDCRRLSRIELPAAAESVGERAFEGCTALRHVSMPAGPDRAFSLGPRALADCTALETADFGGEGPREIGDEALAGCTALVAARFGGTAARIGEGIFRGCRSLRAAELPPGATELPRDCFAGCSALASLELPETVVSIGPGALRGCASLRALALPPQLAEIGEDALRGCTALRRLELPSAEVRFGRGALGGCDALRVAWASDDPATAAGVPAASLAVRGGTPVPAAAAAARPHRAKTARERVGAVSWRYRPAPEGDGAEIVGAEPAVTLGFFRDFPAGAIETMVALADVAVPERLGGLPVAALGPDALRQLGPSRLAVPASVRRVGAGAVAAAGLEKLSFAGPPPALDPAWIAREPADDDPLDFLDYPAAFAREWEAALAPALPSAQPPAGAPAGTFVGEEESDGVRWTYSVRDGRAWVGAGPGRPAVPPGTAGALAIPERLGGLPVGGIAPCAFLGMDRLESVRVGGARADFEIGDRAFRGCAALADLSWDAACAVASVGAEALRDCTALERFDATGVRRFGAAALAGCTALRTLRLDAGLDALPPLFAAGCRSLDSLELPVGVVGRGAFRGCTALRAVRFPTWLRVLGAGAFAGCRALERADVPASCTRVGPGVFDRTPLADAADASADAPPAVPPPPAHGFGRSGFGFARLVAEPDRGVLPADVPVCATVRFSLEGAKVPAEDPGSVRTAVNLALVVDRSAAMQGEPFRRECDAALGVLELLGLDGRDAVTVVAAGRRAEVLASGLPATEKNRAALAAKIRALEPDDAPAAALFAGVAAGAAGLRAAPAPATAAGARVAKLVVVYGAPPGDGPAAPDDWRRLGASFGKEGFAVVAVGVAPDPSEKRLRALAEGAGGVSFASFHAVTGAGVPAIVAGAVDDSFRTVGTDAKLSVRFRGGAVPAGADGRVSVSGDVLEAALGPVVAGCGTTVAVRVEFPPGVPGETLGFAVAEAVWTLPDGTTGSASVPCSVLFSEPGRSSP